MQCKWCGKIYSNGYGGGYCSRRCYEEGHRRTCKGCGVTFTGSGYSGSGLIFGSGADWCSEACYRKNATPLQKKTDKLVLSIILICVFPPLLFLLYWRQTLAAIRFLFGMIFSGWFWKYVVPVVMTGVAVVVFLIRRGEAEACESELLRYSESVNAGVRKELDAMIRDRVQKLEEEDRRCAAEALKRRDEAVRRKAELDAATTAIKVERRRNQKVANIATFAEERFPSYVKRKQTLKKEIQKLNRQLHKYGLTLGLDIVKLESDEKYVRMLIARNRLIQERRRIVRQIESAYWKCVETE